MVIGRRSLLLAGVAVPAAAASARAQCVTDTPGVDACLGGVRITQPPGVTLDLSFFGPTLDPRITFTRASTATYFDSSGVMQTAATNAPRFDYDPVTHAARGLLIEEARTNVVINSVPPGANWFPLQTTQTANSGIAPDGTNSMVRLAETATTNNHIDVCNVSPLTASTVYTGSVYAKAAENRYLQLVYDDNAAARVFATFDLVAGTITGAIAIAGTAIAGTASINAVGGGIFRCSISGQIGITSGRFIVALSNVAAPAGAFPSYAGTAANGLLFWGAQLELGAFPTSYIPTTAAAVTRSADLASMPTAAWFTAASGTYQGEFIPNGVAAGLPIVISGNAGSPTIATGADSRMTAGIRSGAAVFSATGPLYTFGAVNKAAFAYLSGASNAAVNSTAFGPSATALTVTGTVVEFGSDGVTPGNNALNGYIRRVRYWPRTLTNAELQSVTR